MKVAEIKWQRRIRSQFGPRMALWLLLVSAAGNVLAEGFSGASVFTNLRLPGGAAFNRIQSVDQDHQGFVWIGTEAGLAVFDGYDFRVYRNDPADLNSIASNSVASLHVDKLGQLWIGLEPGGVNRFVPESGHFRRFGRTGQGTAIDETVYVIFSDSRGRVWAGGDSGLAYIAPDDSVVNVSDVATYAVLEDQSGVIWAGTEFGLASLDESAGSFVYEPRANLPEDDEKGVEVWRAEIASDGAIWFGGTGAGLRRYDPRTGELVVHRHVANDPDSLTVDDVYAMLLDADGNLWVGTYGGLERYLADEQRFEHHPSRQEVLGSITHPYVSALFKDQQGTLWVATFGGGLHLLRENPLHVDYYTHDPRDATTISENRVHSLLVDSAGQVWAGTYNSGLNRIDPERHLVTRYPGTDVGPFGQPRRLWEFVEDRRGSIWIATSKGVLVKQPGDESFQGFEQAFPSLPPFEAEDVWALAEGPDGHIWIGTFGAGLYEFDPIEIRLAHYPAGDPARPGLSDDFITDLAFDGDGRLLVGTYWSGLVIDEGDRFAPLAALPTRSAINLIRPLPDGRILVGMRGEGLHVLVDDQPFRHYTTADGLPSNFIEAFGFDHQGTLWVTTDHGLARLNENQETFSQFRLSADSEGQAFLAGALEVDADGRLWLGSEFGLHVLDTTAPLPPASESPVVITRLETRQRSLALAPEGPLARAAVALKHSESALSIEFAALQFYHADLVEYAYQLEGFDDDWVRTDSERRIASYTNLSPGNYVFRVRARSPDGVWQDARPIELQLAAPPWRSGWAYLIYALALALLGGLMMKLLLARRRLSRMHHRELAEREERLELALWGSGDWLWDWDVPSKRIFCPQMADFLGIDGQDGRMTVAQYNAALDPEDLQMIIDDSRQHIFTRDNLQYEFRINDAAGHQHWMLIRGKVVNRDATSRPVRVTGTCKDISAQKSAERSLRLAAQVLENSHDAVAILDLEFRFLQVNQAFETVTGYIEQEVLGQPSDILNSGKYPPEFGDQIRAALDRRDEWRGELWERRKTGELYYSDLSVSAVRDEKGTVGHYVAVFSDITRRYKIEEELRHLANYDALTGLPNRTLFDERLAHSMVKARRRVSRVVLMMIDVDDFRHINESRGHMVGDLVLKQVSERLLALLREEDTIARLSADEFAVLVEGTESEAEVQDLARVMHSAFEEPIVVSEEDLHLQASIGVSIYPGDGNDGPTMIRNAQTALSFAKEESRGMARFYAGDMRESKLSRLRLSEQLSVALVNNQLRLRYQPKVDARNGEICGVEALLRWQHPERGLLAPDEFIPMAEKRGQIFEMGEWVLRRSCQQMMSLREHGLPVVPLAVNLSPRQTEDDELVQRVANILQSTGFDPGLLQLELTESMIMAQAGQAVKVLERLKALKLKLVVDDFGTGYSSLSYLNRLPIDHIKIDKSFVQNLESDRFSKAIVSAVLSMADSLGLIVTAEGIENERQLELLRDAGCREIQGYLIARPMTFEDLVTFLRDNPRWPMSSASSEATA